MISPLSLKSSLLGVPALSLWLALSAPATAQTPEGASTRYASELANQFVQVTLNDGTLKYGKLVAVTQSDVVIDVVGLGPTSIPKYLVQDLSAVQVDAAQMEQGYAYVSNQPSPRTAPSQTSRVCSHEMRTLSSKTRKWLTPPSSSLR